MFSITIENEVKVHRFLRTVQVDFIDVFLTDKVSLWVANTSDIFSTIMLPCMHSASEKQYSFRVRRSLLQQLLVNGSIDVELKDDNIILSFLGIEDTLICEVEFPCQKAFSTAYQHKLDLVRGAGSCAAFSLKAVQTLSAVAKELGGSVNIDSGIASVSTVLGYKVCQKVDFEYSLCLTYEKINILKMCSDRVFCIENFVGAVNGNFAVLTAKSKVSDNDELLEITQNASQYRTKYEASFHLDGLLRFVRVHKCNCQTFAISLKDKMCIIEEMGMTFKVPIRITDEKRAKNLEMDSVLIPASLLTRVLGKFGESVFLVRKKKDFYQIETGSYTILFS